MLREGCLLLPSSSNHTAAENSSGRPWNHQGLSRPLHPGQRRPSGQAGTSTLRPAQCTEIRSTRGPGGAPPAPASTMCLSWAPIVSLQTLIPANICTWRDTGQFQVFVLVGAAPRLPGKQNFDICEGQNDLTVRALFLPRAHTICPLRYKK